MHAGFPPQHVHVQELHVYHCLLRAGWCDQVPYLLLHQQQGLRVERWLHDDHQFRVVGLRSTLSRLVRLFRRLKINYRSFQE